MPAKSDHLAQAKQNEDCSHALDRNKFGDWAMTTLFYSALHYVDAFLATKGMGGTHPGGHRSRDAMVAKTPELRPIETEYMLLKTRSSDARYYCVRFTRAEVEAEQRGSFKRIKDRVSTMLKI